MQGLFRASPNALWIRRLDHKFLTHGAFACGRRGQTESEAKSVRTETSHWPTLFRRLHFPICSSHSRGSDFVSKRRALKRVGRTPFLPPPWHLPCLKTPHLRRPAPPGPSTSTVPVPAFRAGWLSGSRASASTVFCKQRWCCALHLEQNSSHRGMSGCGGDTQMHVRQWQQLAMQRAATQGAEGRRESVDLKRPPTAGPR